MSTGCRARQFHVSLYNLIRSLPPQPPTLQTDPMSSSLISDKRGVYAEVTLGEPHANIGCICHMCTCGKHSCPSHDADTKKQFEHTGSSTYAADFAAKSNRAVAVTRAVPRGVHAAIEQHPFDGTSSYDADFTTPKVTGHVLPTRRRAVATAPTKPQIPFSGSTTTADAFRTWTLPEPTLRSKQSSSGVGGDVKASAPFEGTSEAASQYIAMAAQPIVPFVPPTQAHTSEPFSGSTTYADNYPRWAPSAAITRVVTAAPQFHGSTAPFDGTTTNGIDFRKRPTAPFPRVAYVQGATSVAYPSAPFDGSSTYRAEYSNKEGGNRLALGPPVRQAPPQMQGPKAATGLPFEGRSCYDADYAAPGGAEASRWARGAHHARGVPTARTPFEGSTTSADAFRAWAIPKREAFVPGAPISGDAATRFQGASEASTQFVAWPAQAREPFVPSMQKMTATAFDASTTYADTFKPWAAGGAPQHGRGIAHSDAWAHEKDSRDWGTEQRQQFIEKPLEQHCPASHLGRPPPFSASPGGAWAGSHVLFDSDSHSWAAGQAGGGSLRETKTDSDDVLGASGIPSMTEPRPAAA